MSLSPEELRAKLIRDHPGRDVIYEGRAGSETLRVFPAGYLKQLRIQNEQDLAVLRARMPPNFDLNRALKRHQQRCVEAGEETLVIVIEAEAA